MAVVQKGCRQSVELDENSEGIWTMAIDMACQLQGPFWALTHLHWAMDSLDSLDTAGAMQDVLTYSRVSPVLGCAR